MRDGRAAFRDGAAASSGEKADFQTSGVVQLPKTNGIKILDGGRVYWDHSANACHYKAANDRDFFIGCAVGDWESGDTSMQVNLNVQPVYLLDIANDPWVDVVVGTQAAGGLGPFRRRGGAYFGALTSTSEAQKIDMLSRAGFAKGANAIVEAIINVISDGAGTAVDVSVGVANDTHATDADSITDSIFVHLNANDVNIYLESDDGTTEVAATDSTIDYTEGTPFEVWFDMRDPADVQIYINGALVLGATVFNVDASAATWKLLVHVEKTSAADTYSLDINRLCARIAEQ
jgi:predicted RecA/RadA family phage recombinase